MADISMLRTLIANGWTRNTRQLFEQRLGKEQFSILKRAYSGAQEDAPIVPKAITNGKDIYLSFSIPLESSNCPFDYSKIPFMFRGKFKSGVQKLLDSFFPKFKNEEINIENIVDKFQHFEFDEAGSMEALIKAMGFDYRKESYKISDLIKLKHVGNTAALKRDSGYTSEVVKDKKNFFDTVGKLFNKSREEIIDAEKLFSKTALNYAIKEQGKTIGYFSIEINDGVLSVGNYVLFPQYRGKRSSMNAILTVRDRVIEQAKQNGIKVIEADVDVSNPQLLGLYKRFGFQENDREFYSFTDEFGKTHSYDSYNLIGYLD